MSRLNTYVLVILVLVFGGLSVTILLQTQVEQQYIDDDLNNISLKHSLLSTKANDHTEGSDSAQVVIVEYADSDCPFCQALLPKLNRIIQEYPDDVLWVYRHSQLSIYPHSHKEAEAMECVFEYGGSEAYKEFRASMYDKTLTGNFDDDATYLSNLATDLGIERFDFVDCFKEGRYTKYVQDQKNVGATLKVSTVPHTFLIDTSTNEIIEIVGNKPLEVYTTIIDAFLSS